MSSAWVRRRKVGGSTRNPKVRVSFQVLYRLGGREATVKTAGSFKTEREARTRRDLVAGWLAQGLNPAVELAKLAAVPVPERTRSREEWRDAWLASRHDLEPGSERTYRPGVNAAIARLDTEDLRLVSVQNCLDTVARLVADYKPATVRNYWTAFAMLLEYVGHDPNPARDRRVKLPSLRRPPVTPPTRGHVEAMLRRLPGKYLLPFALIEHTAVRVETIDTAVWENTDLAGCRLRVSEKGRKVRWVPLPDWLARLLADTCPPEDRRPDRRLFPGVTSGGLRTAMANACQQAGIPHYTPHKLRHRRASLWHLQAIPDAVLAERLGHEKASFSKDVYAHVMPDEEVPVEVWKELLV